MQNRITAILAGRSGGLVRDPERRRRPDIGERPAATGSANQAYATGQTVLFMVDDDVNSTAFTSPRRATTPRSAGELSIVGTLLATASTAAGDIVCGV